MADEKEINAAFKWERQPKAEALIQGVIDECCGQSPWIAHFRDELLARTSSRLFDWVDHIVVGNSPQQEQELEETGFVAEEAHPSYRVFYHPGAQLPRIVVKDHDQPVIGIAVKSDSIADFLQVRGISGWIEGGIYSGYRRCSVITENDITFYVIERRGTRTMEPTYPGGAYAEKYLEALEMWQTRPRDLDDSDENMQRTISLAEELVANVGRDLAAWIVLEGERKYWQARNTAGQIQKNRQDRLGLGWANHDHHTFRSSRRHFPQLVRLFEILGFHCRERFYAGEEAGWGAQVMENSNSGLVLFLDVDLDPHELEIDFSHHAIPALPHLGTIGLWCELHGDSILKAGMHHLEAQFMFEQLTNDLHHFGIGMMEPFSDFSYLKQAFTAGELWHVDPKRIQKLVDGGFISNVEADKFRAYGAVGSHLENLQRREGYKGFNQKNVSFIIKKTDPRSLSQK